MKTRRGGGMQIESCYGRLLRLRPNLRHLNMTREPTPFSQRGKCESNVKCRATKKILNSRTPRPFVIFSAAHFRPSHSCSRNLETAGQNSRKDIIDSIFEFKSFVDFKKAFKYILDQYSIIVHILIITSQITPLFHE